MEDCKMQEIAIQLHLQLRLMEQKSVGKLCERREGARYSCQLGKQTDAITCVTRLGASSNQLQRIEENQILSKLK